MVLRLRITIALLDGEIDEDMERAARRLLMLVAAELLRASARADERGTERR